MRPLGPVTPAEVVSWFAMKRTPPSEDDCIQIVNYINGSLTSRRPGRIDSERIVVFSGKKDKALLAAIEQVRLKATREGELYRELVISVQDDEASEKLPEYEDAAEAYGNLTYLLSWMKSRIKRDAELDVSFPSPLHLEMRRLTRQGQAALARNGRLVQAVRFDSPLVRFVVAALGRLGHAIPAPTVQTVIERGRWLRQS